MKIVLQRVTEASVSVGNQVVGAIGTGLVVFLCIEKGDDEKLCEHYARKIVEMRIFNDDQGKMNRSLLETRGAVLLVSQFTLAADAEKGRRPGFDRAAPPEFAQRLYELFAARLHSHGVKVATGEFQAMMQVRLVNDGPVTILLGRSGLQ